jgi:hypothetical protein
MGHSLETVPWAKQVSYEVYADGRLIESGKLTPYAKTSEKMASIELSLEKLSLKEYGEHRVSLNLSSILVEASSY